MLVDPATSPDSWPMDFYQMSPPMSLPLKRAFANEWQQACTARHEGRLDVAFARLERAHIIGQLTRTVAASLFTRTWVPEGNTGGANVSAIRPMPIPENPRKILHPTCE